MRLQVTPLLAGSFETAAVIGVACPCSSVCALLGVNATEMAKRLMVTEELLLGSETEVAVTVTLEAEATAEGAVYVTDVVVWPLSAPAPVSVHVTPFASVSLLTVAVMLAVAPACSEGDVEGERVTEIGAGPPPHPASKIIAAINDINENFRDEGAASWGVKFI